MNATRRLVLAANHSRISPIVAVAGNALNCSCITDCAVKPSASLIFVRGMMSIMAPSPVRPATLRR